MNHRITLRERQTGKIGKSGMSLSEKRRLAKIGMALSMGTLVYTGFRGKEAATVHIGAGLALVGFSFWHYRLYQPSGS